MVPEEPAPRVTAAPLLLLGPVVWGGGGVVFGIMNTRRRGTVWALVNEAEGWDGRRGGHYQGMAMVDDQLQRF